MRRRCTFTGVSHSGKCGRLAEALVELDATAARQPDRRGLAYLRALARIATGQPWETTGLTPAEGNTLRLVQGLVQGKPKRSGRRSCRSRCSARGTELWQALVAMRADATAAPAEQLKAALDQNTRKPVSRILHYYKGVAAMRAGDRDAAQGAWLHAQSAGLTSPSLTENLTALLRGEAVELAQEGRWQDLVNLISRLPASGADRIVAETGSLAYYHLGYEAAQAGKWPIAAQHWRKANELDANRYLSQNLALAEEALENWLNAAEAWREMVRRRPRKEDHPDYLTDAQVAALWNHAAECYQHTELHGEVETCLRNAIKYAPDDTALRLRLADVLLEQQRGDAAETQLHGDHGAGATASSRHWCAWAGSTRGGGIATRCPSGGRCWRSTRRTLKPARRWPTTTSRWLTMSRRLPPIASRMAHPGKSNDRNAGDRPAGIARPSEAAGGARHRPRARASAQTGP